MLDNKGFDLWAYEYDKTVQESDRRDEYPFAGYSLIMERIYSQVIQKANAKVFEIGIGTGVLAGQLYKKGHTIHGIDFSKAMISIAKSKMPHGLIIEGDVQKGIPQAFTSHKYDAIISNYTLHHLTDEEKITFILNLLPLLKEEGKIYIGDISFPTRTHLEKSRVEYRNYRAPDEFYFVYDEIYAKLKGHCTCEYEQISHCGGLYVISK